MSKTIVIRLFVSAAVVLFCWQGGAYPATPSKSTGFVAFENGQIVKGTSSISSNVSMNHGWLERLLMQFSNEFTPAERLKCIVAIEAQLGFSYPPILIDRSTFLSRFWLYPARIDGVYTLGVQESPCLQVGFGYFPYQMNKSVRNLGEFLFRSGTYPPYLVNNFNMPFTRLLGFRLTSYLWKNFQHDLLFTSEPFVFPTQDFSLSYVAHYTPHKNLELGGGISLSRLFSVDEGFTSPTLRDIRNQYITLEGDTAYYTFKGTKLDIMVSFDPKPFLPSLISDMLGPEDAELYTEGCITGWKNYKNYNSDTTLTLPDYENRLNRSVAMFGFNIPAFKQLDVLCLEFEYKPTTYTNSYKSIIDDNLPLPVVPDPLTKIEPWKWSLYAKKTFLERFTIMGQVARDHMRPNVPLFVLAERDDVLFRPDHWWWVCRLMIKY
jgi:hypothetical protein